MSLALQSKKFLFLFGSAETQNSSLRRISFQDITFNKKNHKGENMGEGNVRGYGSIGPKQDPFPGIVSRSDSRALVLHSFSVNPAGSVFVATMNALFRHSMELQREEYRRFVSPMGRMVLLAGTSTAGKSSIISRYLEEVPGSAEGGIDRSGRHIVVSQMEEQLPTEMLLLQEALGPNASDVALMNAVFSPDFRPPYRDDYSFRDIQEAQQVAQRVRKRYVFHNVDIDKVLLEEALCNSLQGKQTIFDHVEVDEIFRKVLQFHVQLPLLFVLVYCPFHKLSQRMDKRNSDAIASGNPHEIREGVFPFEQVAKLFGPKEREEDIVLETLSRKTVVSDCRRHFRADVKEMKRKSPDEYRELLGGLEGKYHLGDERKLLQREEDEVVGEILKSLGFTSDLIQTVEISPRSKIHGVLLDTSRVNPEQSVRILLHDKSET